MNGNARRIADVFRHTNICLDSDYFLLILVRVTPDNKGCVITVF